MFRLAPALAALVAASVSGTAQVPLRMPPLRIVVAQEGVHEIPAEELARFVALDALDLDRLALFRDGQEIPTEARVASQGRTSRGDSIYFYARRPASPHSHHDVYVLKPMTGRVRARIGRPKDPPGGSAAEDALRVVSFEQDEVFDALPSVQAEVVRGKPLPHWFWKRIAAPVPQAKDGRVEESQATFLLTVTPEPRRSEPSTLTIDVVGAVVPGIAQRLAVNVNGKDIGEAAWESPLQHRIELRIPANTLDRQNSIQIRNLSPTPFYEEPGNEVAKRRRNAVFVDRMTLTCRTLLAGPSTPGTQTVYHLRRESDGAPAELGFGSLNRDGFVLWDATRNVMGVQARRTTLGPENELVICCVGPAGAFQPVAIEPLLETRAHLPGEGAEWIAVTASRFLPQVERLARHRQQEGLSTAVVEARALYDTFTHGRFDPDAIRQFVRAANKNWKKKPRYLLIAGDADYDVDWVSTKEVVPAFQVSTDYNGATGTDALYGDLDGDDSPDLAVGRLPGRNTDEVSAMVDRIILLETEPEPGEWRRTLRFVAGEARFNPAVDKLLEGVLRKVLTEHVPPGFRMSMTWANPNSPYFWPAETFGQQVLSQINEGCLVFTYVGHGSPQHFDSVRVGDRRYTIMDDKAAALVDTGKHHPVVAIIACWTGEFDRPDRDCIAETLLRQPRGPVAVIASSRISHPFPDALFGKGLASAFFAGDARLGDVVHAAKLAMMKESGGLMLAIAKPFLSPALDPAKLVRDHLWLYNLLGDPAQRVPVPARGLELSVDGEPARGAPLRIAGKGPAGASDGEVAISIDRLVAKPDANAGGSDAPAATVEAQIIENHRRANQQSVVETRRIVQGSSWTIEFPLPADLPAGEYRLSAFWIPVTGPVTLGTLPLSVK